MNLLVHSFQGLHADDNIPFVLIPGSAEDAFQVEHQRCTMDFPISVRNSLCWSERGIQVISSLTLSLS